MGEIEKNETELEKLSRELAQYHFDLAIDLRKHWETRHILQRTGAKYLAGFDTKGKFPWLDVALEWAEDSALLAKRQHASDDLINLVDAVSAAADPDREMIVDHIAESGLRVKKPLPSVIEPALFQRRVVCIHAGAGNEIKQWPEEHFVTLMDDLIESEDVNVVLVGGPDEATLGEKILSLSAHPESIWSVIGTLKLTELPNLLIRCALFIGNDSGPKHLAAGLGIPTIGIHSGVVDAREWGPKGINAVATFRDMTCSPCYRNKVEDCHRGLSCLRGLGPAEVAVVSRRMLAIHKNG